MEPKIRRNWTRNETILALNLYYSLPHGQRIKSNKHIIELASFIHRTPDAVAMKLGNFARLDINEIKEGRSGLSNGSMLDKEIWNEFVNDLARFRDEVESVLKSISSVKNSD